MSEDVRNDGSQAPPMRSLVTPAILVTVLGTAAHAMTVLVQILIAHRGFSSRLAASLRLRYMSRP